MEAPLHCFALLKTVLDDAYEAIQGSSQERDEAVAREFVRLNDRYSKLTLEVSQPSEEQVDYRNPVTRFAYVYKYVASHANLVYQIIKTSPDLRALLSATELDVACIGGGPGSDLLGMFKYLEEKKQPVTLGCAIFDAETAWGETWFDVLKHLHSEVRVLPYPGVFDVTDPKSWVKFSRYRKFDLFTMIYFMSEVFRLRDRAEP
jgi:hypothetical protein